MQQQQLNSLQQSAMKKNETERSGVARCQKCFKYGHLTYECQNQAVYRYRPSRTMQYKQKLQMQIKASKPPKVSIVNPDYKRRARDDGPSSDSNEQQEQQAVQKQAGVKLEKQNIENKTNNKEEQKKKEQVQQEEQNSSSDSSDSSSSSSSSQSSDSSEEQEQEKEQGEQTGPRKKKPTRS